ncbi:putative wd40 repeat protein [Botrytis cinerea BcDW1]|uniref:Putative wd40 repeat protein n=1 Tax=Botryotinia fuckeliana (strain BcDW1) TaxID=1290391 RepID=M7UW92_BOTF1|nr:putative wd40 repeat protein [Botrytis cinerea BcDW1]
MPTPASAASPQFTRLANIWKVLSLRSDVDNIILELVGQFSLEKVYSDGDKETYQNLVITLFAQLSAIFYIQRLSIPSAKLRQEGWNLGFLASWEVTLRMIEFVLHIVIEGRESLWESRQLRDKYLAELLLSALRVLQLLPQPQSDGQSQSKIELQRKIRRDRFGRIHRSLEHMFDSYPGPKSFLLLVCKEITESLRGPEPNPLALPSKLRDELPNLAAELNLLIKPYESYADCHASFHLQYPLNDCFSPKYVSTLILADGSGGGGEGGGAGGGGGWLAQFLALRDITQFVVAASIQYTINGEPRDAYLPAASERTRNAVLRATENMRIPPRFSKEDLVATFTDQYRIILPDTPDLRRLSMQIEMDDKELDAIDTLCLRLDDRQIISRHADDDLYAQLDNPDINEVRLPSKTKCVQCEEPVTIMREMALARQVWDLLEPFESHTDAMHLERHVPTYFQLPPPKVDGAIPYHPAHGNSTASNVKMRTYDTEPPSPFHNKTSFISAAAQDRSRSLPHTMPSQISPSVGTFSQRLDTPNTLPSSSSDLTSLDGSRSGETSRIPELRKNSTTTDETPFSPDSIGNTSPNDHNPYGMGSEGGTYFVNRSAMSQSHSERKKSKGGSKWTSVFTGTRKESIPGQSVETTSLSSSSLEAQRLDEINLESLVRVPRKTSKSKSAKAINISLSQNSTNGLFWTQSLIQIWDMGASPPAMTRVFPTESSCYKASVTKMYLAYIIGTRDPKLTLRIVNLQTSAPVVEYPLPPNLWASSIAISPNETTVAVGFTNATVHFFKTTQSSEPREDRLHSRIHTECEDCPEVETLSYSDDGMHLLASTRSAKSGAIQIYFWMTPMQSSQELVSCRYHVPLHESEDRGLSSAIFRSRTGIEEVLVCITTWTQSGVPVLVHPKTGQKTDIRTAPNRSGKLGSRIQCASFSPSGKELAMVNEKGHLYLISALNSSPLDIRKIAVSRELTIKSDSFAMAFMSLPDEEAAIVMAWIDPSKAERGVVRKIPLTTNDIATTSPILHKSELNSASSAPNTYMSGALNELPGDSRPTEMMADEEPITKYRMMGFVKFPKK